jgi:ribonuclease BN (tRNA processing enzyme)
MKVTVLGSSGSVGAPDNPASGYLVQPGNGTNVIMDIGPGVLAKLQQVADPVDAHVVFSHMHPDHCLDFPSLMVWRRYHPTGAAKGRNLCFGPADAAVRMGRIDADTIDDIVDFSDTFAFGKWVPGQPEILDALTITPFTAVHPIESYSLRIKHDRTGKILAYSGDSSWTDQLIECARDADVFLCEATWCDNDEGNPPNMHLSGAEAGRIAREAGVGKLVLIHIPPWGDADACLAAARSEFDGEVSVAYSGMEIDV